MKVKWIGVIAACALALSFNQARADTFEDFNIVGTFDAPIGSAVDPFTGRLTVDTTTIRVTAAFVSILGGYVMQGGPQAGPALGLTSTTQNLGCDPNNPNSHPTCFDSLTLIVDIAALLTNQTGTASGGYDCQLCGNGGLIRGTLSPVVPLPGALPLFATGLAALGLLGRRWRNRNAPRSRQI